MKKSLVEALNYAEALSKHPGNHDNVVRVLDKRYQRAIVYTVDWLADEEVRHGWSVVAEFKNGQCIRQEV